MLIHSTFKIKFSNKELVAADWARMLERDECKALHVNRTKIDSLL